MVTNAYPMTVAEVAAIMRVKEKTVRRWMHDGANGKKLAHKQLPGGAYRISPTALNQFLGWDIQTMADISRLENSPLSV